MSLKYPNARFQIYSEVIGSFVPIYWITEKDFQEHFLSKHELEGMSGEDYIIAIANDFICEKHYVTDLEEPMRSAACIEIFAKAAERHPFIELSKVSQSLSIEKGYEKEEPTPAALVEYKEFFDGLKKHMHTNIIGQKEAVDSCVAALMRSYLRKPEEPRPMACLMFAGISGVGKTETAKQIALAIRPDGKGLVKIDCAEFGESHQSMRLLGAPTGYLGHGEPTILEAKLDGGPQVILFDEFEKAHPRLHNLLLGMMEDGILTTSSEKVISVSQCIIILTSNLGSSEITRDWEAGLGFKTEARKYSKEAVKKKIEKEFPVEFINRLDDIIIFDELSDEEKIEIGDLQMKAFAKRYDHLVKIGWHQDVKSWLIQNDRKSGARGSRKRVDQLAALLADKIIENPKITHALIGVTDGEPYVRTE